MLLHILTATANLVLTEDVTCVNADVLTVTECIYRVNFSHEIMGGGMLNIVLVFHDMLKSYLVSIYLLILAISGITYGHLVTMATKAYTYNISLKV